MPDMILLHGDADQPDQRDARTPLTDRTRARQLVERLTDEASDRGRPRAGRARAVRRPPMNAALDTELHVFAREHVARVRERCPDALPIDIDVWVGAVLAHLAPLPADRPWRRRWQAPRGSASWVGGRVGVHLPRPRGAA